MSEAARYGLLVNRGVMRVRQKDLAAAEADFRAAITLRPNQYQGYLNLALARLSAERWDDALAQLDRAVQLDPGVPAVYRTRARLRQLRGDLDAAVTDLAEAVSREANPAAAAADHLERGEMLFRRGEFVAALAAADAAAGGRPRDARVARLRAEALAGLGRPAEAAAALDDCLRHGPPDAGAFRARAALRTRLGEYAGAQADYTRAIELDPDAPTFAARGWCHLVAGAPRLALADFDEAVRRDPAAGDGYAGRGYARVLLGDAAAAAADAGEALARGPQTPRLCYNAARVYARAVARLDRQGVFVGTDGGARRAELETRAVAALARALDQQPRAAAAAFWRAAGPDPAFDAIRHGPAFTVLAEQYAPGLAADRE